MAYNHAFAFFLIALGLFAAATPLADAQNINVLGLNVNGTLCCTHTGNCPGRGVSGVNVTLICRNVLGASVVVGRNTTDTAGRFNIAVNNVLGLVLNGTLLPCIATVALPLNGVVCPILSTVDGTLVGLLQTVGELIPGVIGLLRNATVSAFVGVAL